MLAALLFFQTFAYQAADTVKGVKERLRDVPTTAEVREAVDDKVDQISQPVTVALDRTAEATQDQIRERTERLQRHLERLQAQIGAIEGAPGPPGPAGPSGPAGASTSAPLPSTTSTTQAGVTPTTRPSTTTTSRPSPTTTTTRCVAGVGRLLKVGCQ